MLHKEEYYFLDNGVLYQNICAHETITQKKLSNEIYLK